MIEYIRGTLTEKEITRVAVEAHGVGYGLNIPLSTYEKLPGPGSDVKLWTHYHVREDTQKLFGFFSRMEREIFRQLINVNMVGPKLALTILSGITIEDLVRCVNSADTSRLEKIPGIGAKTAQRLLVELKGKLGVSSSPTSSSVGVPHVSSGPVTVREEVFAAMISLGYNDKQVEKALQRVAQTIGSEEPLEEWIKKALQVI